MQLGFFNAESLSSPCLMGWSRFYQTIGITAKRFPSLCLPICQTLAFDFLNPLNRAFAICHIAKVMAVVKLREIQRQMLFADMVECSDHATFKQAEKSFNTIGSDHPILFAESIFAHCMLNCMMLIFRFQTTITTMLVRMNFGASRNIFTNSGLQSLASDALHHLAANATAAFKQCNNRNFVFPITHSNIFPFAADVGLVH